MELMQFQNEVEQRQNQRDVEQLQCQNVVKIECKREEEQEECLPEVKTEYQDDVVQMQYPKDIGKLASKSNHKCPHPGCGSVFNRPNRLKAHLNVHSGERPYRCTFKGCGRAYTNKCYLHRHKQVSHNPLTVKCKYKCTIGDCVKEFRYSLNLQRHIEQRHESPFNCEICKKGFKKQHQLQTHEFEHTSIYPFRCDLCDTGYLTVRGLKRHNQRHKKCTCEFCGLEFRNALLLRKHHGQEHKTSYTCETCGKLFQNKTRLTHHVAVHLDPSHRIVFPCPHKTCSRFYYAKKNMDYHVRVFHEGKENNKQKCHICGNKLCSKKLKRHLKLHDRMGVNETLQPPVSESTLKQEVMGDVEHIEPELSEEELAVEVNPLGLNDKLPDSDQDEMVGKGIDPPAKISVQDPSSFTGENGNENIPNDSSLHSEMILVSVKQEYIKEEDPTDTDIYTAPLKEEPNTNVTPVPVPPPIGKTIPKFSNGIPTINNIVIKTECEAGIY